MPAIVLIGAQWGDEGKGKATDLLGGRISSTVSVFGIEQRDRVINFNTTSATGVVLEGLLPCLNPAAWRRVFEQALRMTDGQIRFMGIASVLGGLSASFSSGAGSSDPAGTNDLALSLSK